MTPEEREARGWGWQDNGPVLRNMPEGALHTHYWSLLETIVWVATRDERAVAGAAGYLRDSKSYDRQVNLEKPSQIILATYLPIDVAGHHLDCPAGWTDKNCTCEALGRARYCRCPARRRKDPDWVCPCTGNATKAVEQAILDGLTVSGKPEGATGWRKIEQDELAGARRWYDPSGLRFVQGFTDLRLRIDAVKERWPAGFAEQLEAPDEKSPQQAELDRLAGVVLNGRPPTHLLGLKIFCDRIDARLTVQARSSEAKAIRTSFPKPEDGKIPEWETIYGWIGEHHRLIDWQSSDDDRLAPAITSALADLKSKVDAKLAGANR